MKAREVEGLDPAEPLRGNAALILTLYLGLAVLLALGMWGTHVPQNRL